MAETGVNVTARRRRGQWSVTKPATVEIDGVAVGQAGWGHPTFFATAPGWRRVTVSYPYLWRQRTDEASIELHVDAGQTIDIEYRSSCLTVPKGTLVVV